MKRIMLPRVAGSSLVAERLVDDAHISPGDDVVVDGLGLVILSDFFAQDFIALLAKRSPSTCLLDQGPPEWHTAASETAASVGLPISIRADYPPGYKRPVF